MSSTAINLSSKAQATEAQATDGDEILQPTATDKYGNKHNKNKGSNLKKKKKKTKLTGNETASLDLSKLHRVPSLVDNKSIGEGKEKKTHELSGKKRKEKNESGSDVSEVYQHDSFDEKSVEGNNEKKKRKLSKKKREKQKVNGVDGNETGQLGAEEEDGPQKLKYKSERVGKKKKKDHISSETISRSIKEKGESVASDVYHISSVDVDSSKGMKNKSKRAGKKKKKDHISSETVSRPIKENSESVASEDYHKSSMDVDSSQGMMSKSESAGKSKKKDHISLETVSRPIKENNESIASKVYHISSVDVDSSKGMKKWINGYYQSRPGLKILQQRIDEFITSHEEQEEKAKEAAKAHAEEGGFTLVEHHRGRKKSTDAESGIVVGSVAQAAVVGNMLRKKSKDVGLNFYRFQQKEAQRNEIMLLQSKFEEDKKRIHQLRAASRKFRP